MPKISLWSVVTGGFTVHFGRVRAKASSIGHRLVRVILEFTFAPNRSSIRWQDPCPLAGRSLTCFDSGCMDRQPTWLMSLSNRGLGAAAQENRCTNAPISTRYYAWRDDPESRGLAGGASPGVGSDAVLLQHGLLACATVLPTHGVQSSLYRLCGWGDWGDCAPILATSSAMERHATAGVRDCIRPWTTMPTDMHSLTGALEIDTSFDFSLMLMTRSNTRIFARSPDD